MTGYSDVPYWQGLVCLVVLSVILGVIVLWLLRTGYKLRIFASDRRPRAPGIKNPPPKTVWAERWRSPKIRMACLEMSKFTFI
jgi:hypothetical protein